MLLALVVLAFEGFLAAFLAAVFFAAAFLGLAAAFFGTAFGLAADLDFAVLPAATAVPIVVEATGLVAGGVVTTGGLVGRAPGAGAGVVAPPDADGRGAQPGASRSNWARATMLGRPQRGQ